MVDVKFKHPSGTLAIIQPAAHSFTITLAFVGGPSSRILATHGSGMTAV